jgi:hypothetical protein
MDETPPEEWELRRPNGKWNCPTHGVVEGRYVHQAGIAGEGGADWRCGKCFNEFVLKAFCQPVTNIPPP